jgi:quercetin dioxygenase-like cupin family protein
MKNMQLLDNLEFHSRDPYAQPLFADKDTRIYRFMLRPGESIREHQGHPSTFHILILKGSGTFGGRDGKEEHFGPNSLLIFDPHESHYVRADDEDLVFVGFLGGATGIEADRVGGVLSRQHA